MRQEIRDNVYYVKSDDDREMMRVELTDLPGDQVIITTPFEVYAGPIGLISFSETPPKYDNTE